MTAERLADLRLYIRSRRAALAGFIEQNAIISLDGDTLTIRPRKHIYARYLTDNCGAVADLASDFYGHRIKVEFGAPDPNASATQERPPNRSIDGSATDGGEQTQAGDGTWLQAARDCRRRGWSPVPVPHRSKAPIIDGWPDLRLDGAELEAAFTHRCNVGVILGKPSGDLVDADLDCAEALALADYFLPATPAVFGRASKRSSHRLYLAESAQTVRFRAPDGTTLVELRSNGGQTVFPPSEHPSGEAITWDRSGDPAPVDAAVLSRAAGTLAAASLIVRKYPKVPGGRHDITLALAGALLRSGWTGERTAHFIEAIARTAGDEEARARLANIKSTERRQVNDGSTTGWPTLGKLIGEREAALVREWLGLRIEQPPEWGEIDFSVLNEGRRPAPPLPINIFGPVWGDWIQAAANSTSAPTDYIAISLLVGASGLVGNARRIMPWAGWIEPIHCWGASVGLPSSGKSPSADAVRDPVRGLEANAANGYAEMLRKWETERAAAKARRTEWEERVKEAIKAKKEPPTLTAEAVEPLRPARPRILIGDTTPEAVAAMLSATPKGLILYRDELAGWIGGFDRYSRGSAERGFWTETYGGRHYVVDRKQQDGVPIDIPFLSVAVFGGIQPDRLGVLLLEGADDGLAARPLYVWPEPSPPRRPISSPNHDLICNAFKKLYDVAMVVDADGRPTYSVLRLSDEAAARFQEWRVVHHQAEKEAAGMFLSWLGKMAGVVLRVAGTLTFLKWSVEADAKEPSQLNDAAIEDAIALVDDYFKPMAERVFGDAALPAEERNAAAVARLIHARKTGAEKEGRYIINGRADVRRRVPGLRAAKDADAALALLCDAGLLRPLPNRTGCSPGRPRADFEVNPAVWEQVPRPDAESTTRANSANSAKTSGPSAGGANFGANGTFGTGESIGTAASPEPGQEAPIQADDLEDPSW